MTNILLLNPPAPSLYIRDYYCSFESKADYYWPPQDLLALSGLLSTAHRVFVLDTIVEKKSTGEICDFIRENHIDNVIFTTGTATMAFEKSSLQEIKDNTGVFIAASAGILKYEAEQFFRRFPFLDAALLDFTDPEISEFFTDPHSKKWDTIWVKKEDRLIQSKNEFKKEFSFPPPQHRLFPFRKYAIPIAKHHPYVVVITSLGCPYQCRFCTIPPYGTKYRNIENTLEELRMIKEMGVKEILFQDPTFTVNTKHMNALLNRMIEEDLTFSFSCNTDINSMNEEKISLMKRAGCHTVNVGLESGNENILVRYNKKLDRQKALDVIRLFKKHKIRTLGYFIVGLPGETVETIEETIAFSKKLDVDFASFAIATPDVGSDLRREAIEEGWIDGDVDFFDSTQNPIMKFPGLSIETIKKMRNKAERQFYLRPSYIWKRISHPSEWKETVKNGFVMLKRIIFGK